LLERLNATSQSGGHQLTVVAGAPRTKQPHHPLACSYLPEHGFKPKRMAGVCRGGRDQRQLVSFDWLVSVESDRPPMDYDASLLSASAPRRCWTISLATTPTGHGGCCDTLPGLGPLPGGRSARSVARTHSGLHRRAGPLPTRTAVTQRFGWLRTALLAAPLIGPSASTGSIPSRPVCSDAGRPHV